MLWVADLRAGRDGRPADSRSTRTTERRVDERRRWVLELEHPVERRAATGTDA